MLKIAATLVAGLLAVCVGTAAQATYPSGSDQGQAVTAGTVQLALNPQPEPPNKNRKNKKPKIKQGIPQTPDNPPPKY